MLIQTDPTHFISINNNLLTTIQKTIGIYTYNQIDKIGSGFSSSVFKGLNNETGQVVAIKVINLHEITTPISRTLLKNEIQVLRQLNHPNLLKVYDVYLTLNNTYIISEYCDQGDVADLISKNKYLNEKLALSLIQQILKGMKELQAQGILHRDIKPANILMTDGIAKLADFGFAVNQDQFLDQSILKNFNVGTPLYMAPESMIHNQYSQKSDIWSLGVVLYEMLHGCPPFEGSSHSNLMNIYMTNNIILPTSNTLSKQVKDLLTNMLLIHQDYRYDLDQVTQAIDQLLRTYTKRVYKQKNKRLINISPSNPIRSSNLNLTKDKDEFFRSTSYQNRQLLKILSPQKVNALSSKRDKSQKSAQQSPLLKTQSKQMSRNPTPNKEQMKDLYNKFRRPIKEKIVLELIKKYTVQSCNISPFKKNQQSNDQINQIFTDAVKIQHIKNLETNLINNSKMVPSILDQGSVEKIMQAKRYHEYQVVSSALSQNNRVILLLCEFLHQQAEALDDFLDGYNLSPTSPPSLLNKRQILTIKCAFLFWKCVAIKANQFLTQDRTFFTQIIDKFRILYQHLLASTYLPTLIENDRRFEVLFDDQVEDDCTGFYAILTHYITEVIKCLMISISRQLKSDEKFDQVIIQTAKQMQKLITLHKVISDHLKYFNSNVLFADQCLQIIELALIRSESNITVNVMRDMFQDARTYLRIN